MLELGSPLSGAVTAASLLAGRASIAPLIIEGHLWAYRSLLSCHSSLRLLGFFMSPG